MRCEWLTAEADDEDLDFIKGTAIRQLAGKRALIIRFVYTDTHLMYAPI